MHSVVHVSLGVASHMYSRVYTCTGGSVRHPYIWYMDGVYCIRMYTVHICMGGGSLHICMGHICNILGEGRGGERGWVVTKMPT